MANLVYAFTIVIVTAGVQSFYIQKLTNYRVVKQDAKNDPENDWRLDENSRRDQVQRFINNNKNKDIGRAKQVMHDVSDIKEQLNVIEQLILQSLPNQKTNVQEPLQISLHPVQIKRNGQNLHMYNTNIYYPEVIDRLENTSVYNDNPQKKRNPASDKSLKSDFFKNAFQTVIIKQEAKNLFDNGEGAEDMRTMEIMSQQLPISANMPKKVVKRMTQLTRAKKDKKVKRARDKRRRKSRNRIKYLRKIGKIPKKKGNGGVEKVKKVYKRYRKGNSTHSFRYNTTQIRVKVKSKTVDESVIPRWVPDGGNSTENIASKQLGSNDEEASDTSTIESSSESDDSDSVSDSYDESDNKKSNKEDEEELESSYEDAEIDDGSVSKGKQESEKKRAKENSKRKRTKRDTSKMYKYNNEESKLNSKGNLGEIKNTENAREINSEHSKLIGFTDQRSKLKFSEQAKFQSENVKDKERNSNTKHEMNNIKMNPNIKITFKINLLRGRNIKSSQMTNKQSEVTLNLEEIKNTENAREINSEHSKLNGLTDQRSKLKFSEQAEFQSENVKDKEINSNTKHEMNNIKVNPDIKITFKTNLLRGRKIKSSHLTNKGTEITFDKNKEIVSTDFKIEGYLSKIKPHRKVKDNMLLDKLSSFNPNIAGRQFARL